MHSTIVKVTSHMYIQPNLTPDKSLSNIFHKMSHLKNNGIKRRQKITIGLWPWTHKIVIMN